MSASVAHRARKPADFEIKDAVCGNEHRFFLSGELDIATAQLLEDMVSRVCSTEATNTVTIDLGEVTFMDSTGLRSVLQAQEFCRIAGYEFRLVSPRRQVRRLFEITGVFDHLHVDEPDG